MKVEYLLLSGGRDENNFPLKYTKNYERGQLISQTQSPEGMFVIVGKSDEKEFLTLEQIPCDSIHWKGDGKGIIHGRNNLCKQNGCKHYEECGVPLIEEFK